MSSIDQLVRQARGILARFRGGDTGAEPTARNLRAIAEEHVEQQGGAISFRTTVEADVELLPTRLDILDGIISQLNAGTLRPEQFRAIFLASITPSIVTAAPAFPPPFPSVLAVFPLGGPPPTIRPGLPVIEEIRRERFQAFQAAPRFEPLARNQFEVDLFDRLRLFKLPQVRFAKPPQNTQEVLALVAEVAAFATTGEFTRPTVFGEFAVVQAGAAPEPAVEPGAFGNLTDAQLDAAEAAIGRLQSIPAQELLDRLIEIDPIVNAFVDSDETEGQDVITQPQFDELVAFLGDSTVQGVSKDVATILNTIVLLPEDARLAAQENFFAWLEGAIEVRDALAAAQDRVDEETFLENTRRLGDILNGLLDGTRAAIGFSRPQGSFTRISKIGPSDRSFTEFDLDLAFARKEISTREYIQMLTTLDEIRGQTVGTGLSDTLEEIGEVGEISFEALQAIGMAFFGGSAARGVGGDGAGRSAKGKLTRRPVKSVTEEPASPEALAIRRAMTNFAQRKGVVPPSKREGVTPEGRRILGEPELGGPNFKANQRNAFRAILDRFRQFYKDNNPPAGTTPPSPARNQKELLDIIRDVFGLWIDSKISTPVRDRLINRWADVRRAFARVADFERLRPPFELLFGRDFFRALNVDRTKFTVQGEPAVPVEPSKLPTQDRVFLENEIAVEAIDALARRGYAKALSRKVENFTIENVIDIVRDNVLANRPGEQRQRRIPVLDRDLPPEERAAAVDRLLRIVEGEAGAPGLRLPAQITPETMREEIVAKLTRMWLRKDPRAPNIVETLRLLSVAPDVIKQVVEVRPEQLGVPQVTPATQTGTAEKKIETEVFGPQPEPTPPRPPTTAQKAALDNLKAEATVLAEEIGKINLETPIPPPPPRPPAPPGGPPTPPAAAPVPDPARELAARKVELAAIDRELTAREQLVRNFLEAARATGNRDLIGAGEKLLEQIQNVRTSFAARQTESVAMLRGFRQALQATQEQFKAQLRPEQQAILDELGRGTENILVRIARNVTSPITSFIIKPIYGRFARAMDRNFKSVFAIMQLFEFGFWAGFIWLFFDEREERSANAIESRARALGGFNFAVDTFLEGVAAQIGRGEFDQAQERLRLAQETLNKWTSTEQDLERLLDDPDNAGLLEEFGKTEIFRTLLDVSKAERTAKNLLITQRRAQLEAARLRREAGTAREQARAAIDILTRTAAERRAEDLEREAAAQEAAQQAVEKRIQQIAPAPER